MITPTPDNDFFLTTGSRLVYDKGFDILIEAINLLPHNIKKDIKCLIVGKGEEKQNLINQSIKDLGSVLKN